VGAFLCWVFLKTNLYRGILVLTIETLFDRALSWIRTRSRRGLSAGSAGRRARLELSCLEDRTAPATFVVNALTDTGTGTGDHGDLRYAITQSNATPGPNTISFDSSVTGTISLTGELPALTQDVAIQGPGTGSLTIDGGNTYRALTVRAGVNATLSGVTIQNASQPATWHTSSSDPEVQQSYPLSDFLQLQLHIHVHLHIIINGYEEVIPTNTGLDYVQNTGHLLHTHDTLNIIHIEDPYRVRDFHLHDFFDIWGQPFTANRILSYDVTPGNPITMTVNGMPNTDFGNLLLADEQDITVRVDGAVLDPTSGNTLGQGGAIFNQGNLTVDSSLLANNQAFEGGAIFNTGTLTVTNTTVANNLTTDTGGGIYTATGGTVTIDNSAFFNQYSAGGGAIWNDESTLTINNSTLSSNASVQYIDYLEGDGGAIYNIGGWTTISNSTLSGNAVTHFGGAIYNFYANVTISNSTLSGNAASNEGGAIYNFPTTTLSIISSTLAENSAGVQGGGIFTPTDSVTTVTLDNTIIARNTGGSNSDDVDGVFASQGYNLIGNGDNASGFGASDQVGTSGAPLDPGLSPLQDNGGPTVTYACSPAAWP
jgi:hypothetical protein